MGVFAFTDEYISRVPPARLFKALAVDSHNLFPKLMPQAIKSIDIIQGDGGVGTIKQINLIEDNYAVSPCYEGTYTYLMNLLLDKRSRIISIKNRVDELNEETLTYRYTMIDLKEKFESIVHEVIFEATPEGGSKSKIRGTCYTGGDVELKEEDVKADKEKILGTFKAVEAYLLQNPNAFA